MHEDIHGRVFSENYIFLFFWKKKLVKEVLTCMLQGVPKTILRSLKKDREMYHLNVSTLLMTLLRWNTLYEREHVINHLNVFSHFFQTVAFENISTTAFLRSYTT